MNFKPWLIFSIGLFFSLLISFVSFAQLPLNNYEKEWKQVDDLINKELPKSALEKVRSIYEQAKKDKQETQWVKAIIYMNHLQETNEQNINDTIQCTM